MVIKILKKFNLWSSCFNTLPLHALYIYMDQPILFISVVNNIHWLANAFISRFYFLYVCIALRFTFSQNHFANRKSIQVCLKMRKRLSILKLKGIFAWSLLLLKGTCIFLVLPFFCGCKLKTLFFFFKLKEKFWQDAWYLNHVRISSK